MALLVLGATLSASTPARAQGTFTYPLSCVVGVDDPDYGSSGEYGFGGIRTLVGWDDLGRPLAAFEGTLWLQCWDLTPGAVYSAYNNTSKAGKDGSVSFTWRHVRLVYRYPWNGQPGYWQWQPSPVYRLNRDKTSTLVLAP
jgi:hypothetical protein